MQTETIDEIRIATRESRLALWQAECVAAQLRRCYPDITVRLVPMTTKGDRILQMPLAEIGGKGLFIKELEIAMENHTADIAVHSLKDVGAQLPPGYAIAAVLARENPYDAFVSKQYRSPEDLPAGAKVGTCSLRRRMQLARLRPDIELTDLRGNVQTRLARLERGEFAAIVLACAGLIRLGLQARITQVFAPEVMLPAIGQGAIGIECRTDSPVYPLVQRLNDRETALCVHTERVISRFLDGSCQLPLAAFARLTPDNTLRLSARLGTPDGKTYISVAEEAPMTESEALGERVARQLIARGGAEIVQSVGHGR